MRIIGVIALFAAALLSSLPGCRPRITSPSSIEGRVGVPFRYQILARGAPSGFALGGPVPSGLQLDLETGVLWGQPTEAGTFEVEVRARNVFGHGHHRVAVTILPSTEPPPPASAPAVSGVVSAEG